MIVCGTLFCIENKKQKKTKTPEYKVPPHFLNGLNKINLLSKKFSTYKLNFIWSFWTLFAYIFYKFHTDYILITFLFFYIHILYKFFAECTGHIYIIYRL